MTESDDDQGSDAGTTGLRRLAIPAVVAFVVTTLLVAALTALSLPEATFSILLVGLGMGLMRVYIHLPLGADLTSSPALGVGVAVAGLLAAIGGFLLAVRYGLGLVENETLVAGGAGVYLVGLTLVGLGIGSIPTYRRLRSAFGPDPGDARPGRVAIGGCVEPVDPTPTEEAIDQPFDAPFSGKQTVCLEAQVTEQSKYERHGQDLLHEERRGVPFELRGATGSVRVDAREAELRLDLDLQTTVEPGEVPDGVASYLSKKDTNRQRDRKPRTFIERRLEPGESATVIGEARRRDGRLVVVDPVVEDGSLDATLSAYRAAIVRGMGGGATLAVFGLASLFVAF